MVLKGAKSLALPLKFGQSMRVIPDANMDLKLRWKAHVRNEEWIEVQLDLHSIEIIETNDIKKAKRLQKILRVAHILNPDILKSTKGLDVFTNINFDINWGLGSSSSLIANIAKWFRLDPFALHFKTSSGSGFDVACANANGPIFYTLNGKQTIVEKVIFEPDFSNHLYFAYLGKKQQSHKSIQYFSSKLAPDIPEIRRISEISTELTATHDLEEFEFFINEHETIMSKILGVPPVKKELFAEFAGEVKSLGAWGGDFVMMTWREGIDSLKAYLKTKKLNVVFPFDDIVLKQNVENVI